MTGRMLFREHRGSFADSLATTVELEDRMVTLRQHVTQLLLPWAGALPIPLPELVRSGLRVRAYGSDPRLPEWTETFIVSLRHYGVVGFCNRLPR
jgi:hypothetical protein